MTGIRENVSLSLTMETIDPTSDPYPVSSGMCPQDGQL